jgi:hypothetical protein
MSVEQFYKDWDHEDRQDLDVETHSLIVDLYEKGQWVQLCNYYKTVVNYSKISEEILAIGRHMPQAKRKAVRESLKA